MKNTTKALLLLFVLIGTGLAAKADAILRVSENRSNIFGGQETLFNIYCASEEGLRGRIGWRFSANGRTIARAESEVSLASGSHEEIAIDLRIPPVKPGVIIEAALDATLTETDSEEALANLHKQLWIFPEDPFAHQKKWLKDLRIQLFDPEEGTAAALESLEIPFDELGSPSAIESIGDGVLIIGEGVSLMDYRGLDELMLEAAARGVPVLCLALSEGEFYLPGTYQSRLPAPTSMEMGRSNRIKAFDKRLDAKGWSPDGKCVASGIVVRGERGPVIGEVENGDDGWPWMAISYREDGGRLMICGYGIIKNWDDSPAPRFLLAEILEYMAGDKGVDE